MRPVDEACRRVDCGTLFSPQKGKCFDINGEIFVCGEVVSPTAGEIERGKIFTATTVNEDSSLVKLHPPRIPDISLLASLSEECQFSHLSDKYATDYEEVQETEATSDILNQGSESSDEPMKTVGLVTKTFKEHESALSWSSLWKSFKSAAMFQCDVSTPEIGCPQCARKLLHQNNPITRRPFPPFCTDCKSYFVHEDYSPEDIEALRDALMEDENPDTTLPFRPTKGKIIMLEEPPMNPSTIITVEPDESKDNEENSATSKENKKNVTRALLDEHISRDIILSSSSDAVSVDITERTDERSVGRTFSAAENSIASDNISVYTEVERQILLKDFDFIREIALREIAKKSRENYAMISNCKTCGMPMMEKDLRPQCVTCPKVFSKAKEIATTKRLCWKENLVKMHFIPRETPRSKSDMSQNNVPQISHDGTNKDIMEERPNLFPFRSRDTCSTNPEFADGVSINGWSLEESNNDANCENTDSRSQDVSNENGSWTNGIQHINRKAPVEVKLTCANAASVSLAAASNITDVTTDNEIKDQSLEPCNDGHDIDGDDSNVTEEWRDRLNEAVGEDREEGKRDDGGGLPLCGRRDRNDVDILDQAVDLFVAVEGDVVDDTSDVRCPTDQFDKYGIQKNPSDISDCLGEGTITYTGERNWEKVQMQVQGQEIDNPFQANEMVNSNESPSHTYRYDKYHTEHKHSGADGTGEVEGKCAETIDCDEVQAMMQGQGIGGSSSQDEAHMRYLQQMNGYVARSESFGKSIGLSFSSKDEYLSVEQEAQSETPKTNNAGLDADSIARSRCTTPVILCTGSSETVSILQGDEAVENGMTNFSCHNEMRMGNDSKSLDGDAGAHFHFFSEPDRVESHSAKHHEVDARLQSIRENEQQDNVNTIRASSYDMNIHNSIPFSPISTSKINREDKGTSVVWDHEHHERHEDNKLPDQIHSQGAFFTTASMQSVDSQERLPDQIHPHDAFFNTTTSMQSAVSHQERHEDKIIPEQIHSDGALFNSTVSIQSIDSRQEGTISAFKDVTNKKKQTNAEVISSLNENIVGARTLKIITNVNSNGENSLRQDQTQHLNDHFHRQNQGKAAQKPSDTGRAYPSKEQFSNLTQQDFLMCNRGYSPSQKENENRRFVDVERLAALLSRLDHVAKEMEEIDETIERAGAGVDFYYIPRGEFV